MKNSSKSKLEKSQIIKKKHAGARKKINKKQGNSKIFENKENQNANTKSKSNKKSRIEFVFDKKILFFLLRFFFIFAALNILIDLAPLGVLNNSIATLSSSLIGLTSKENAIIVGEKVFLVTNSCTGLISVSILAAIIFSLKRPVLRKKIFLFIGGAILILLLNIPRISLILFSAKMGFDAELAHTLTWFFMSAIVLIIWYFGTKKIEEINEFNELL